MSELHSSNKEYLRLVFFRGQLISAELRAAETGISLEDGRPAIVGGVSPPPFFSSSLASVIPLRSHLSFDCSVVLWAPESSIMVIM